MVNYTSTFTYLPNIVAGIYTLTLSCKMPSEYSSLNYQLGILTRW